jgi:1-acyl-sn-glycerol-3-phosphate acyltransferase
MTRSPYDRVKAVFDPLSRLLFDVSVEGFENLPEDGMYIIASNHIKWCDPILISVRMPVQLSFAAKIELFRIPGVRSLVTKTEQIPLDRKNAHLRDVQRGLIEAAKERMSRGIVFALFPEGTRSRTGRLLPFKRGVVMIAAETERPIVPIGISYSGHWPRKKARIVIGKPIQTTGRRNTRELAKQLEGEISRLSGQQLTQVAAGR